MVNLKELYAAHFYEAASYHAQRVKLLQNPNLREYDEDEYETCTHAAMCAEMFITGKVIEHNPSEVVPSQLLKTRNRESIALSALQDNDVNKVDINALVSLQMCGAAEMLKKYIDIEKDHFKSDNIEEQLKSFGYCAQLLINGRNDVLHRHHMQTQSIRPVTAFSYLRQLIDAVYGDNSMEHQYFTGTYYRDTPALTELLERYLSTPFEKPESISINKYAKKIHKIASNYTALMRRKKQYPNLSLTTDIVTCPKCDEYAFLTKRMEALATYWEGEPNNSISVLEIFNPSGKSRETLQCPICQLEWKDDVLHLYQDIGEIKHLKTHIPPDELSKEFKQYYYSHCN
ncbi:hypothetical protein AALA48_04580 [Bifidobacterium pseudolongum]|uniref:hypothetical protein n=1 Tax=Bifidobacterium pseudolongum TaxID=1694 RepID=UPI0035195070